MMVVFPNLAICVLIVGIILFAALLPAPPPQLQPAWRLGDMPRDGVTWIEIETRWGVEPYCCVVRWNPALITRSGTGGWQQADGGYFEDAPYRWRPATRQPALLQKAPSDV
ncbi:MAG TPA: hypothetical protein VEA80_06755 [Vitreimonas sp.]|uniref:hypothetical protein n=1 Tax=Vitreimonas sp. TaxID=3069702 RepID=UPI002D520A0C|nr:hypothetical protein [Vitreimonas sp.]HYD87154.1 hypothetical protein [Vitreimonas sp.]